jgi:hypothetical protein
MGNVGIPTKHKGRQFRSRLEARWATFFDLLGWTYEYEPFDLDGWIPDFALTGGHDLVLVEIKPVVVFPTDSARKIAKAKPDHEVLLVGCAIEPPCLNDESSPCPSLIQFGWLRPRPGDDMAGVWSGADIGPDWWDVASFGYFHEDEWPCIGFSAVEGDYFNRVGGSIGTHKYYACNGINASKFVKQKWAEAGNRVQWMAPH